MFEKQAAPFGDIFCFCTSGVSPNPGRFTAGLEADHGATEDFDRAALSGGAGAPRKKSPKAVAVREPCGELSEGKAPLGEATAFCSGLEAHGGEDIVGGAPLGNCNGIFAGDAAIQVDGAAAAFVGAFSGLEAHGGDFIAGAEPGGNCKRPTEGGALPLKTSAPGPAVLSSSAIICCKPFDFFSTISCA